MTDRELYDTIGRTYAVTRRTEPRVAARIWSALGDARSVLNVGAGTGSYEPPDRDVTAVEPSAVMRAQRAAGAAQLFDGWPSLTRLADAIDARTTPVPIPWDCSDGIFEAYWRRPEAYLDERIRRGMSVWTKVGHAAEQRAVRTLERDLDSGRWAERNRDLLCLDSADLGLRLLIA